MSWAGLRKRYSHPVAPTNGTVGVRRVDAGARSPFKHLAARTRDGIRLHATRLTRCCSVRSRSAGLLFIVGICLAGSLGNSLRILLILVHSPIENIVVLKSLANKKIAENLAQVAVVGLVIESKRPCIVEVNGKFVRESAAKHLGWRSHLLLHNTVILLLLRSSLQALPRQRTTAEIEHDIAEGFHVVSARLLYAEMGVDGGISRGTSEVFVLTVRDMKVRLGVPVLLRKAEVDDIDLIAALTDAHQEVVRFNVTVNETLRMYVLNARNKLICKEKHRLQRELAVAEVEKVLKTRPEEIKNHCVVVALGAEPPHKGNADAASQRLVYASFVLKLRVLCLDRFELDGDFLAGNDVGAEVDVTKGSGSDLSADAVFITNSKVLEIVVSFLVII